MMSVLQSLRPLLLAVAIIGFCCVNLPFLYYAFIERDVYDAAMDNGMALVFMGEAFFLMLFFAFIIARLKWRPGWIFFIAMSLLGSMAFSIPLQLYLISRPGKNTGLPINHTGGNAING